MGSEMCIRDSSYAVSLVAALDAGRAHGHMEALAAPFCRATAGCVAASIPHEHVGMVTTGGWGAFSDGAAPNATTLEGLRGSPRRTRCKAAGCTTPSSAGPTRGAACRR